VCLGIGGQQKKINRKEIEQRRKDCPKNGILFLHPGCDNYGRCPQKKAEVFLRGKGAKMSRLFLTNIYVRGGYFILNRSDFLMWFLPPKLH
jgi:hypothetical protein